MITVDLDYAIVVDGMETDRLTVRRPRVKDMLSVDKDSRSDAEKELYLFANLCEVPMDCLLELDLKDYQQLQVAYQGFL